jgi:hypothetical protein
MNRGVVGKAASSVQEATGIERGFTPLHLTTALALGMFVASPTSAAKRRKPA